MCICVWLIVSSDLIVRLRSLNEISLTLSFVCGLIALALEDENAFARLSFLNGETTGQFILRFTQFVAKPNCFVLGRL